MHQRLQLATALVLLLALSLTTTVAAGSGGNDTVSRGEAEAVFNAFPNGGWAVRLNQGAGLGAPADGLTGRTTIRPFNSFDGARYCVEDWHAVMIAAIDGGDASYSRNDAAEIFDTTEITLTLDGSELEQVRTPVIPFLNPEPFGWEKAYAIQEGQILSPSELSVGPHTLHVYAIDAEENEFENSITFYVDPAGSAACTS